MKLYGNNIEAFTYKILLASNLFSLLKEIQTNNPEAIIITPLTKIKDLFNLQKNSALFELMHQLDNYYQTKIVDQDFIVKLTNQINQQIGFEVISPIFDFTKVSKNLFEIENTFLTDQQVLQTLTFLNRYATKNLDIILIGFENSLSKLNFEHLNIFILTNNIEKIINWHNLATLVICQKHNFMEIEDKEILLNWLETKTKTVLTLDDLSNYFENKYNFNSFLIEKALKVLK